jgi:hypothetical protein
LLFILCVTSLSIAFLAVYIVRVLKKKVHILVNNAGLLAKDYDEFCTKGFYNRIKKLDSNGSEVDIKVARADNSTKGAPECMQKDLIDADITYCTSRGMQTMYAHRIGLSYYNDVILIVDEVDDLIIDKNPNDLYGVPHHHKSLELKSGFDALISNENARKPDDIPDFVTWRRIKSSVRIAKSKREGTDYCINDGKFIMKDDKGRPDPHAYSLWLEFIRYKKHHVSPVFKSYYYMQSMAHMMSSYCCVLGLSGTLGSPQEMKLLEETYLVESYGVPYFLETCLGNNGTPLEKHKPVLLREYGVQILQSKDVSSLLQIVNCF